MTKKKMKISKLGWILIILAIIALAVGAYYFGGSVPQPPALPA